MYAVIVRAKVSGDPAKRDELTRRADTELTPHLRQAPGLRDRYVVYDEASGTTHLIAIWDSQADAVAFDATAEAQAWTRTAQGLGSQREATYQGEVVRHVSARS